MDIKVDLIKLIDQPCFIENLKDYINFLEYLLLCSENCTDEDFTEWQIIFQDREKNGISIQYCSGGSWHYLCSGGVGWTSTLATVACRQLGYSDKGG